MLFRSVGPTESQIAQGLSKIPMEEAVAGTSREAVADVLQRRAQEEVMQTAAEKVAAMSPFDRISAGIKSLGTEGGISNLVSELGGPSKAAYTAAGLAAPLFAGESARLKMPQTTTPTAYITPYAFDPSTHELRSLGRYEASKFPGFAASARGGLQSLADGGVAFEAGNTPSYQHTSTSPGMLDFAQRSEPVVRMADGGVAHYDGSAGSLVGNPIPTADQLSTITNMYRNVLGRDPDQGGLDYWSKRLAGGEDVGSVYNALQGSAKTVLASEGITAPTTLTTPLTLAQATAGTPTGYSAPSTYNTTMADEWAQNVLGRGLTATDKQQ